MSQGVSGRMVRHGRYSRPIAALLLFPTKLPSFLATPCIALSVGAFLSVTRSPSSPLPPPRDGRGMFCNTPAPSPPAPGPMIDPGLNPPSPTAALAIDGLVPSTTSCVAYETRRCVLVRSEPPPPPEPVAWWCAALGSCGRKADTSCVWVGTDMTESWAVGWEETLVVSSVRYSLMSAYTHTHTHTRAHTHIHTHARTHVVIPAELNISFPTGTPLNNASGHTTWHLCAVHTHKVAHRHKAHTDIDIHKRHPGLWVDRPSCATRSGFSAPTPTHPHTQTVSPQGRTQSLHRQSPVLVRQVASVAVLPCPASDTRDPPHHRHRHSLYVE